MYENVVNSKALGIGKVFLRELPKSGQTFPVKGQIINIFSYVDPWSLLQLFNSTVIVSVKPALDQKNGI